MKNSTLKFGIIILLVITMIASTISCANNAGSESETSKAPTEVPKKIITIKYPTFMVGTNPAASYHDELMKKFNAIYSDEIKVEVEELATDQAYTDKMKTLMASNSLPDVLISGSDRENQAVKLGAAVDLMPYLDADPEWKSALGDSINDFIKDGKLFNAPEARDVIGYFYNKEMFQDAGIKPAESWDEFFSNCDKLKEKGYIPLALMTGENAWTTNLILAAMVGSANEAGNKFMNTQHPKDYSTPEFINALKNVENMLKNYTYSDVLGAKYANAANYFLSGEAAIMANGLWMVPDFTDTTKVEEGFDKKVGYTTYPNGVISIVRPGYLICSKDKEHADAAAKFVKFITDENGQQLRLDMLTLGPLSPKVTISDELKESNPYFTEIISAMDKIEFKYGFIDLISYANVTNEFQNLYPALSQGEITAEEMATKLSELAQKNSD